MLLFDSDIMKSFFRLVHLLVEDERLLQAVNGIICRPHFNVTTATEHNMRFSVREYVQTS